MAESATKKVKKSTEKNTDDVAAKQMGVAKYELADELRTASITQRSADLRGSIDSLRMPAKSALKAGSRIGGKSDPRNGRKTDPRIGQKPDPRIGRKWSAALRESHDAGQQNLTAEVARTTPLTKDLRTNASCLAEQKSTLFLDRPWPAQNLEPAFLTFLNQVLRNF